MKRLANKDATGKPIKVGDIVRIIGVPDLSGMSPACRAESLPVFKHLVGSYKRVYEFDESGCAWVCFKIQKGASGGLHTVGIEPYLLRVRRKARSREAAA